MSGTGGVAFAALTAIILSTLLVRMLGRAALGELENRAVLPFIGFGLVHYLPVLLSLALFIGVFLSLSRSWSDSEMVIWMGSGLSAFSWLSAVLRFAVPVTLVIAFMSTVVIPWASHKRFEYERILSTRDQISGLTPGVFVESEPGGHVIFVESQGGNGTHIQNVFVYSTQNGRSGVIVARDGVVTERPNGDRFVVLRQGRRYEGVPGEADYRMMEFESYAIRLKPTVGKTRDQSIHAVPTVDLLRSRSPNYMAEWAWRLGFPISALLLALSAVPLSHINPRAGRSTNIIFAMLVYTIYSNFIGLSEGWVTEGRLSAMGGLLVVHGSMALMLVWLYWRYMHGPRGR
jgi:lipopolysaccharide export system permease protein